MPKVVFLGSANMDTTMKLKGEFPEEGTSECENLVESIARTAGGKAFNQLLAFLKQCPDAEVSFVGCIGGVPKRDENGNVIIDKKTGQEVLEPDESGKVIHDILTNPDTGLSKVVLKMFYRMLDENGEQILDENNKPKFIKTDGRIIQVDKNGQNRMTGYGDAIKQLTPRNVSELDSVLEGADMVVIQLKMPAETVKYIIDYCEKNNVKLLIDPTPLENSKLLVENNCELLKKATYLSPNEEEAFALAMYAIGKDVDEVKTLYKKTSPEQRVEMIKSLVKTSPNVFVTMGGDGVIFNKDGQVISQETYPTECRNSTGAGDSFNGAFAASIIRGEDYETALLYGLLVSSIKVREEFGTTEGVLYYDETKEIFENTERPNSVVEAIGLTQGDEIPKEVAEVIEEDETPIIPNDSSVHSTDDNDGDEPR